MTATVFFTSAMTVIGEVLRFGQALALVRAVQTIAEGRGGWAWAAVALALTFAHYGLSTVTRTRALPPADDQDDGPRWTRISRLATLLALLAVWLPVAAAASLFILVTGTLAGHRAAALLKDAVERDHHLRSDRRRHWVSAFARPLSFLAGGGARLHWREIERAANRDDNLESTRLRAALGLDVVREATANLLLSVIALSFLVETCPLSSARGLLGTAMALSAVTAGLSCAFKRLLTTLA